MRARSIPCRVNADTRVGVAHIRALAAEGGCVQTSLEAKPGNAALWKRQRRHEVLASPGKRSARQIGFDARDQGELRGR